MPTPRRSPRASPTARAPARVLSESELVATANAHYLDRPVERATPAILQAIGVSLRPIGQSAKSGTHSTLELATATELLQEHSGHERADFASYTLDEGSAFVDVRDSGDAWVRLTLAPGVEIQLDGTVLRRLALDPRAGNVTLHQSISGPANGFAPRFPRVDDALQAAATQTAAPLSTRHRELTCALCRQYYDTEWMTGTGGAMSLRLGERIFVTPSGVPKELLKPDDLFVLDIKGEVLSSPAQLPGHKAPKLSDCAPLFASVHELRKADAVIHSHGVTCNLLTAICEGQDAFRISHQEMIKGISGHGYDDELVVPIIENAPTEHELEAPIREVLKKFPKTLAVLVRRHGLFVWGDTWEAAKRHAECLHYLFQVAIEMHRLQLDYTLPLSANGSAAVANPRKRARLDDGAKAASSSIAEQHKYIILDIEGTTTPITFVHDVLFPFVVNNAESFLRETWTDATTQADVAALAAQHAEDVKAGSNPPPLGDIKDEKVIPQLAAYVQWNVKADRKIGALKQLQGHMWNEGYESGELKALVYEDVPPFFERMGESGVRVGIYSSGSRQAQKLLFQFSDRGDLRPHLSVYFDTKVGHKREVGSYEQILQSLGVDSGKDVLFVTDVIEEAEAAAAAGVDAVLSVRPGNKPLPASHPFRTITSFDQL